jgi:Cu-processing system ATP-binding protein
MISFDAFTKRFGAHTAVDSLTLEVARGEVVALLGPNGSGKTTTLKAAAGLIHPSSGRVTLGDPPRPASVPSAREVLSYLPQKVSFPDALTGAEVVEFFRQLRGAPPERSQKVLRFASLNGAGGRMVGTYSGGMVQRLGLAVAMLPEAPVFLLDEPTAALDPDGLCAFYGLVEHAREDGRAVLFTSHQLGDAERLADRFAVLVEGRLVAELDAAELKDRLAERGVMRLRFGSTPDTLLEAVRSLAPAACWASAWREGSSGPDRSDELIVPGPAALRPRVLDAVRALGVEVRGLTADEGRLDTLYRELVGEAESRSGHGEARR